MKTAFQQEGATEGQNLSNSLHVAVIGAGPGGLATGRQLLAYGHRVTILETTSNIGGVWGQEASSWDAVGGLPDKCPEDLTSGRLWPTIRSNAPRESMGFRSLPFLPKFMLGKSVDSEQFPSHKEVTAYYSAFAEEYDLISHIHFNRRVVLVQPAEPLHGPPISKSNVASWPRWTVTTKTTASSPGGVWVESGPTETDTYDAVAVCVGHHTLPYVPAIPGASQFKGLQIHSFSYRSPDAFKGAVVLVVGSRPSGEDISLEVARSARAVYHCGTFWLNQSVELVHAPAFGRNRNVWRHHELKEIDSEGCAIFGDGRKSEPVDAIIWATGYRQYLPFLSDKAGVVVQDGRILELFMHVFSPVSGPTLAFIGVSHSFHILPEVELQGTWFARLLAGLARLPPVADMKDWVHNREAAVLANGLPLYKIHIMLDVDEDFAYSEELTALAGVPPFFPWRKEILKVLVSRVVSCIDSDLPGQNFRVKSLDHNVDGSPFDYGEAAIAEHKNWLHFEEGQRKILAKEI